jgi:hypothetical protein
MADDWHTSICASRILTEGYRVQRGSDRQHEAREDYYVHYIANWQFLHLLALLGKFDWINRRPSVFEVSRLYCHGGLGTYHQFLP